MTNETANAVTCAQCGATSPAGTRLCRHCWAPLTAAPSVRADDVAIAASDRERRGLNARSWVRIFVTAALVLFVAWIVYRTLDGRLINRPGPLPAGSSAASAPALPGAWPLSNGGPAGTRTTSATVPIDGDSAWRTTLPATLIVPPLADAERVYVSLSDGTLRAYRADDGAEAWVAAVPGVLDAAPAIGDGRIYAGLRDSTVMAVDAATGAQIWRIHVGTSVSAAPLILDGTVYIVTNTEFVGMDAITGKVLWRQALRDKLATVVPVANEDYIVIATFRRVSILDRETGRELFEWEILGGNGPIRSVAIDGNVLAMTAESGVFVIDIAQRRPWWEGVRRVWEFFHLVGLGPDSPWRAFLFSTRGARDNTPVVAANGVLYAADRGGALRAFESTTGVLLWTAPGPVTAPVTLTASGLLVPTRTGVSLLDPATGAVSAERPLPEPVRYAVVTEDALYAISESSITAIR
ncbi:MAG: PQQ-binding-like beta-propeller repeat protein [Chloroflexi bacterium]|nr:PQQ-binding-like beta-propeller repeat protein [Chloroflexota bacterium]MDA1001949.1 PQQ-binding-like beta-propeller repeat protein [Chloroflexota bacterium]